MTRARVDSSPAVAGGRVYVGSSDGRCTCSTRRPAQKQWEFDAGDAITASPAIAAGRVVIGARTAGSTASDRLMHDVNAQTDLWFFVASGFRWLTCNLQRPILMDDTARTALADQTEVGSYFVATYPPFSVWTQEAVERDARPALAPPPDPTVPLGLYLHIPFCRKRCHFCYFRVYTDKNAQEVAHYLDVLAREWELYARAAGDRRPAARTSSTSAAARRRSSRRSSSQRW